MSPDPSHIVLPNVLSIFFGLDHCILLSFSNGFTNVRVTSIFFVMFIMIACSFRKISEFNLGCITNTLCVLVLLVIYLVELMIN